MKGDQTLILKDKQSRILLLLLKDGQRDWSIDALSKESNTTYVHTCNFILECERQNLVVGEKHGKNKIVKLTEKGSKIAESISNIYNLLDYRKETALDNSKGPEPTI